MKNINKILALLECGKPAFRKANTTPGYEFWAIT